MLPKVYYKVVIFNACIGIISIMVKIKIYVPVSILGVWLSFIISYLDYGCGNRPTYMANTFYKRSNITKQQKNTLQ
jgi:hypothetical protein